MSSASAKVDYAALKDTLQLSTSGDGEVSLSVDGTNELRAKLGLAPLNDSVSSSAAKEQAQAEKNFRLAQQASQEARRLAEIEAELARAKRKREASAQLPRSTLGDSDDEVDAAEWVRRSRARGAGKADAATAALEAERRARLLFEQEQTYGSEHLGGLSVAAHSAEGLQKGEGRILTLADEQILNYDDEKHGKLVGLREGTDKLQNVDTAELDAIKRRKADRAEEVALHMGGAVADDYEFETGGAAGAGATLAKYDQRSRRALDLKIGAAGVVQAGDQTHLTGAAIARLAEKLGEGARADAEAREREGTDALKSGKWGSGGVDASASTFEAQRDYMTADEARKLFKKKDKKLRKKQQPRSVLDGLGEADGGGNRGSRAAARARRANPEEDRARKAESYVAAQRKAQEKTDAGLGKAVAEEKKGGGGGGAAPMDLDEEEAKPKAKFVAGLGDDDDDAELRASLARARDLKRKAAPKGEAAAALMASKVKEEAVTEEAEAEAADALVFTSTTEFTARLRARLEERAAENEEQKAEEARAPAPMEESSDSDSDDSDARALEAERRGELVDFLHKQPLARGGMAATMALLQQTGDVQTKHVEATIGRARDLTQAQFNDGSTDEQKVGAIVDNGRGEKIQLKPIKIEYRDSDGKLLTRKEAYRQMCHKFHGKGPGKKKTEKFAAREAERQRSIKMSAGAGSMSILQHAQERTGQAYVPINNQQAYASMGTDPHAAKSKKKKKKEKKKRERAEQGF